MDRASAAASDAPAMIPFHAAVVATPPRTRILRTAERLFAELGVGNVSLETVAAAAGVDRAELRWHFADADSLANEVLRAVARRSAIVRLEALSRLEGEADRDGLAPTLRAVIESYCIPFFDPETGPLLATLTVAHLATPTPWSVSVVRDECDDVARRYIQALGRAAPHLGTQTLGWRYHFMLSNALLTAFTTEMPTRLARLGFGGSRGFPPIRVRDELVSFLVAGFGAEETGRRGAD